MNAQIQVYHFILDPRVGGPHVYVNTINKELEGRVSSCIITAGKGPLTDMALLNFRHYWHPLYFLELLINPLLILFWVLIGKLRVRNSIFHVHGAANLSPIIAAWILRVRLVWHFHETLLMFRPLVKVGLFLVAGLRHEIVVVTAKIADIFGLKKFTVIPPPIDLDYWGRDLVSVTRGNDDYDIFRIVSIGNLNPLKGHDILLDALTHLDGGWELSIAGARLSNQERYADLLMEKASHIRQKNPLCKINFLGWCNREKIRAILAASDVFVLASRSEAGPIALLEAIAMSCPSICTDVGGISGILNNEEKGFIIPPGEPERLTQALEKMHMLTPMQRLTMAQKAKEEIIETYDVKNISNLIFNVYRTLKPTQ